MWFSKVTFSHNNSHVCLSLGFFFSLVSLSFLLGLLYSFHRILPGFFISLFLSGAGEKQQQGRRRGTCVTVAFSQSSTLQYHSIQGSKGLSQDWFSWLEEERHYLKRQYLSQERPGYYPTTRPLVPNVRAGRRAPVGVVVKLAVKCVSNLSSWVVEITHRVTDQNQRCENCWYFLCFFVLPFPKELWHQGETEIGAFMVIWENV